MINEFFTSCDKVICLEDAFKIVMEIFGILIISMLIIRVITKKIKFSNSLIIVLALVIQVIVASFFEAELDYFLYDIEIWNTVLIIWYLVYTFSFFSTNRNLSLREIVTGTGFKVSCLLLIVFELMFLLEIASKSLDIYYDTFFLYWLLMIRIYAYVFLHSAANKIEETLPPWVTQFYTFYEVGSEMENKPLPVLIYVVIFRIGLFIRDHKFLFGALSLVVVGPYLLLVVEMLFIAHSIRKLFTKWDLFYYNAWLFTSGFIISFLTGIFLGEAVDRFKIIIEML